MNSHPNLVSSAKWQSRDLHSSPVIFLRDCINRSVYAVMLCHVLQKGAAKVNASKRERNKLNSLIENGQKSAWIQPNTQ